MHKLVRRYYVNIEDAIDDIPTNGIRFEFSKKLLEYKPKLIAKRINEAEEKMLEYYEGNREFTPSEIIFYNTIESFDSLPIDLREKCLELHTHAELCKPYEIVYKESDVLNIIETILNSNCINNRKLLTDFYRSIECSDYLYPDECDMHIDNFMNDYKQF